MNRTITKLGFDPAALIRRLTQKGLVHFPGPRLLKTTPEKRAYQAKYQASLTPEKRRAMQDRVNEYRKLARANGKQNY